MSAPQRAGARPGVRLLVSSALTVACLTACRGVDAKAHDLRALHAPDGSILEQARVARGFEFVFGRMGKIPDVSPGTWALRAADAGAPEDVDLVFHPRADPVPRRVERPQTRAFERLLELEQESSRDPYVAGVQVELAAFLATRSRAKLLRERSILILGDAADRLEVGEVRQQTPDAMAADSWSERLASLAATIDGGDSGAIATEVDGLASIELELDDWRRTLRFTTALRRVLSKRAWRDGSIDALHRRAQAECVALALGRGLRDPSAHVAGVATRQALRIDRSRLHGIYLDALDSSSWAIAAACLESIVDQGLPDGEPPLDVWLESLVGVTRVVDSESIEDDRLRLLAAQALGRVAPTELESLRSEEWLQWYWGYSDRIVDDAFSSDLTGGGPR